MKNITYKTEEGRKAGGWLRAALDRLDDIFAAVAFAEEGERDTALTFIDRGSGQPMCKEGYYYDEDKRLCAAKG